MSIQRKIRQRKQRRVQRVRAKFTGAHPRVSVFRSLSHMYAQLINDEQNHTITSASSRDIPETNEDKKAVAHRVGLLLAEKAKAQGITRVIFDRGSFLYHGRVKAVAEGLIAGGITI